MKLKKILSTSSFILMSTPALAGLGDPYDTVVMCRACPAGYVGNGSGTECTACAGGTYQNQTGQSSCITCNAGSWSSGKTMACQTCPAGTYSGAKASGCSTCPAGTYSKAGASSCTQCSEGTYQNETGKTECKTCHANTKPTSIPGKNCGNYTVDITGYCQGTGSKGDMDKPAKIGETTINLGSCSGHTYCSSNVCTNCSKPEENSSWSGNSGCDWGCNSGYTKINNAVCCKEPPANAEWKSTVSSCDDWQCKSGYDKVNGVCKRKIFVHVESGFALSWTYVKKNEYGYYQCETQFGGCDMATPYSAHEGDICNNTAGCCATTGGYIYVGSCSCDCDSTTGKDRRIRVYCSRSEGKLFQKGQAMYFD